MKRVHLAVTVALAAALVVSSVWHSPFSIGKQWSLPLGWHPGSTEAAAMLAAKNFGESVCDFVVSHASAIAATLLGSGDWKCAVIPRIYAPVAIFAATILLAIMCDSGHGDH